MALDFYLRYGALDDANVEGIITVIISLIAPFFLQDVSRGDC